jgi:hypothetical protein
MGVHASSVISTTINTHDSALYTAITDKEEYCYNSGTNGQLTEYQPIFSDLSAAIIAYFNRNDVDPNNALITRKEKLQFTIMGLFGYKTFYDMYSTSGAQLSASNAFTVLGMGGYRSRIKTDALAYYDDYPTVSFNSNTSPTDDTITRSAGSWLTDGFTTGNVTVTGSTSNNSTFNVTNVTATTLTVSSNPLSSESASQNVVVVQGSTARMGGTKIYSDIGLFNTVAEINAEHGRMDTLLQAYRDTMGAQQFKLLWEDITPGATLDKDGMNTYILDTLNWRGIVPTVLGLAAPPVP